MINLKEAGFLETDQFSDSTTRITIPNYNDSRFTVDSYQMASINITFGEQPYIRQRISTIHYLYNRNYGDDRVCKCGHTYYRHFDSYDNMESVGCKYCGCYCFEEQAK